ncbi:cytochrome oxidase maturation protein, cbb3-type [Shewanella halifaxensis HAW-EB4]|uniref:Cytochrome oxidase maturation protein, cbb3-type n=1 Tax=Shewanella halifaxensis (strain HAW-EB4) TaxID=458817 RepID=B0TUN4_SHEHH|nr:cbb3-type cytochrome oxidase assembly protein CcoS [Shewanella halifaxensis]ABZ76762.1 cytochrome oxidase maturation protein, cbb3-type [Shewanella halifaxensis HAW-EB4]
MSIIYVLIPIAMLFVLLAVGVFFWAVKSDQFDDLEKQSVSILFEDDTPQNDNSSKQQIPENTTVPETTTNATDTNNTASALDNSNDKRSV